MKARNLLIALLVLLGLSASGGGAYLIVSPSGKLIGLPLSLLDKSPFSNYLIPGVVLFSLLGIAPFIVVYALLKKPENKLAESINFFNDLHWSLSFTVYIALALIIWIQFEMMFIKTYDPLQTFCSFLGLAIIFIVLLPQVRILYKKQQT
jgi:hypothetical protein